MKLVDMGDSKFPARKGVPVQVRPLVPFPQLIKAFPVGNLANRDVHCSNRPYAHATRRHRRITTDLDGLVRHCLKHNEVVTITISTAMLLET